MSIPTVIVPYADKKAGKAQSQNDRLQALAYAAFRRGRQQRLAHPFTPTIRTLANIALGRSE